MLVYQSVVLMAQGATRKSCFPGELGRRSWWTKGVVLLFLWRPVWWGENAEKMMIPTKKEAGADGFFQRNSWIFLLRSLICFPTSWPWPSRTSFLLHRNPLKNAKNDWILLVYPCCFVIKIKARDTPFRHNRQRRSSHCQIHSKNNNNNNYYYYYYNYNHNHNHNHNNNNNNHISRTTSSGPKADPKLLQWECLGQRKSRHVLESSKTLSSILVVGNNVGNPIININLPFGDGMYIYIHIYIYIYMYICVSSMHL